MMSSRWPDDDSSSRQRNASETFDGRLTRCLAERLHAHPVIRRSPITVEVQNGVAMLRGAATPDLRRVAVETAYATQGIRDVCNMLTATRLDEASTAPPLATEQTRANAETDDRTAASSSQQHLGSRTVRVGYMALVWWLACVLITALGWVAVVIGCVCAAVTLEILRVRRLRRD